MPKSWILIAILALYVGWMFGLSFERNADSAPNGVATGFDASIPPVSAAPPDYVSRPAPPLLAAIAESEGRRFQIMVRSFESLEPVWGVAVSLDD
jgi:hypothetical protein